MQKKTDDLSVQLGARIRALREQRKLRITDLADMTGLTSSMISQVERALLSPSIATLKKIGNAMDIPLALLFEGNDDAQANEVPIQTEVLRQDVGSLESYMKSMAANANMVAKSNPVVHKEQRKILSPGKGVRFYLLNPDMSGPIEFIYNEYDPGSTTGIGMYSHPGCECGLILSGELVVQINNDVYTLKEGDSITFNATDPHLKKNVGKEMCTCIWANVPPWF